MRMLKSLVVCLVVALAQFAQGATYELDCRRSDAPGLAAGLSVGDTLAITLTDGQRYNLELVEKSPSKVGSEAFLGRIEGAGGLLNAVLARDGNRVNITLVSPSDGLTYIVQSAPNGTRVRKVNPADYIRTPSPIRVPAYKPSVARRSQIVRQVGTDECVMVDVLIAYDNGAKAWLDNENQSVEMFAQSAVARMNTALANTGLTSFFRFRLVGTLVVNTRSTDLEAVLDGVTDAVGVWSAVSRYRDEVGADIVTTLIDTGSASGTTGIGWALLDNYNRGRDYSWFADNAYNACAIRSVAISHTMTHEVGHNMGAGHSDVQSSSPGPQLFSYSSGYYFEANGRWYHTIMAYNWDGRSNIRYEEAPYFSSPNYTHEGTAVGDSIHDNTLTLKNTFAEVAAFRASKVSPGDDPEPEPDPPTGSLTWYTTKAEAFAAAQASGKRILLVYGRDTCSNTSATRYYTCEDETVKAKLLADYILWYSNCDTQLQESYRYLMNFGGNLPGVSVIDPVRDQTIVGTDGPQSVSSMLALLASAEGYVPPAIPANDNFDNALEISGENGTIDGSNVGATIQSGEPLLAAYSKVGSTVWWKWTAPANGSVTIDTIGSTLDTQMGIYAGSSLSSLSLVRKDDDSGRGLTSLCTFDCVSGTTYYICVGGYGGDSGAIVLNWQMATTYTVTFDANGGYCSPSSKQYPSGSVLGMLPTPTRSRDYRFVGWYTSLDGGVAVSPSTIVTEDMTVYAHWIYVPPELPNDNFANAIAISGTTGTITGTNAGATLQSDEPLLTSFPSVTTTVWWKWTAPGRGTVTVGTVGSSFDTKMGIYTGSTLSSLSLVRKDDDSGADMTSICTFTCTGGTTYYICVGGCDDKSGTIVLQWNFDSMLPYYAICFNMNDGSDVVDTWGFDGGIGEALPWPGSELGWTRSDYTFSGWSIAPKSAIPTYANHETVTDIAAPGRTINLYAIWKPNSNYTYTVRFHAMDGTERTYDQTFNKSESKCLAYLESGIGWSRPGYIFCGWSDVGSSHVCKYNNGTKVYDLSLIPDDVVDLYAVWLSTSSHRIRYVRNIPGYDEVTREHVFWKGTSDTLAWVESQLNWNYKGYTFAGWSRSQTATRPEFTNGQRVQDLAESGKTLTLYAVWTANNP